MLVGGAYLLIFSWIVAAGHGVPYVMDNNETFSVWWHSYNLFHFDFWKSAGLSDDAYSFDAAAHPVVHPHQGNWPRIFGFLIFVLGARSVEAQIIVTTLTIGVAAIWLPYHFFARKVNPVFAAIFCLVLMSDYVLYTQWHINTYRVWHLLLLFAALLCAAGWESRQTGRWTVLTLVTYAALYYWELVFTAFVSAFVGSYTLYLYWRRPWLLIRAVGCQLAGAAFGLTVLVVQLIGFYGLSGLKSDFYFTFLARNHVDSLQQLATQMHDFYDAQNVAFWYNFGDNAEYLHLITFLRSFFSYDFQTHTPVFTALVLIAGLPVLCTGWRIGGISRPWPTAAIVVSGVLAAAAMVAGGLSYGRGGAGLAAFLSGLGLLAAMPAFGRIFRGVLDREYRSAPAALASGIPDLVLCAGFTLLLLAVSSPFMVDAMPPQDRWVVGRLWIGALGGGILLAGLTKWLAGLHWWRTPAGTRSRILLVGLLLVGSAAFLRYQSGLYAQDSALLWQKLGSMNYPALAFQLAIVAAAVLASVVVISSRPWFWPELGEVKIYLLCGMIGYIFTFVLSAGYVYSGYLSRSAPFTVFLTDAVVAAAAYCLWAVLRPGLAALRGSYGSRQAAMAILPGALLFFGVTSWLWQQADYIRLLPPDFLRFMTKLEEPPYRESSFTVGTYAAPVAAYTRKWAYYSDELKYWAAREGEGPDARPNGAAQPASALSYLWMADKRNNAAYFKPQYYLCLYNQTLTTLSDRLKTQLGTGAVNSCGSLVHSVDELSQQTWRALTPTVADRDRDGDVVRGWEAWAILKFDWDFPPFVRADNSTTRVRPVRLEASPGDELMRLSYRYQYAQHDDMAEAASTVELVKLGAVAACKEESLLVTVLDKHGSSDRGDFALPRDFVGKVAIRVVPRTTTKAGRSYYSETLSFSGNGQTPVPCQNRQILPGEPTPQQLASQGYYVPGKVVDFRASTWDFPFVGEGWWDVEELGRWSVDTKSTFSLQFQGPIERSLRLTAKVLPFVVPAHPRQVVAVLANGRAVATWTFDKPGWTTVSADIPPQDLSGRTTLELSFVGMDVVSPAAIGSSVDRRRLKLLFQTATFDEP